MIRSRRSPVNKVSSAALNQAIQLSLFGSSDTILIPTHTGPKQPVYDWTTALVPPLASGQPAAKPEPTAARLNANNFRLRADWQAPTGVISRIKANIEAIRLAKRINSEDRPATREEKHFLVNYTGWGGLASVFEQPADNPPTPNDARNKYDVYRLALDSLLTAEELENAELSTLNAFYTTPGVVSAIWQVVEGFGFTGGRILEPAAGIGHFCGCMPEAIAQTSNLYAVEKDTVSGQILGLLYPDADLTVDGLEDAALDNGSFDLVIGNVPFGAYTVYDRQNSDLSAFSIHNYFIGRATRLVREGGLIALVTTAGTMDATGETFRQWLSREGGAELIGAVRLPSSAFAETGTSVTTDLLFFRKREGVIRQFAANSYERTRTVRTHVTGEGDDQTVRTLAVNEYFASRPDMMLGEMTWADEVGKGGLYRGDQQTLFLANPETLPTLLQTAIDTLPKTIFTPSSATPEQRTRLDNRMDAFTASVSIKGRTYTQATIIREYERLKGAFMTLLKAEQDDESETILDQLRSQLNEFYTLFTRRFGNLNRNRAVAFLEIWDSRFSSVQALEVAGKVNGKVQFGRATIFWERVYVAPQLPKRADSLADAVHLSLMYYNRLSVRAVADWLAKTPDEVTAELLRSELAYLDPRTETLIDRDSYLSGNVRQKHADAQHKARQDPRFALNHRALAAVVPATVPSALISFRLGSVWLPDSIIKHWITDALNLSTVEVRYNSRSKEYEIDKAGGVYSVKNTSLGTSHRTALDLIEAALNGRTVLITKTIYEEGKQRVVKDVEATSQAIQAQEQLNELFVDFVREHYTAQVETAYNELYNAHVAKTYHKPTWRYYPGAAPAIQLRDHQFKAVERIKEQDVLLAHAVGSGKTYTMITGAMELKRLGIAHKPMLVVQNSTVDDVARSWRTLYPSALLYVPQASDLEAANRRRFLQRIATNNYDGIVIPQSFLKLIPDDPASEEAFIQEEIERVTAAVAAAERQDKSRRSMVKRLNELKLRLEARRLRQADRKLDNILTFDQLGIDALFLDECHKYKRLGFYTKRHQVKGIDTAGSEDALSAMFKCRSVQSRQGRVVLATGTPISNTMAEAWTMLRFVAPERLEYARLSTFDQFAGAFGSIIASFELTTTGNFKAVERFARFVNVRQLSELYRSHVDVILNDDVVEFQRDKTLPTLKVNDEGAPAFTRVVLPQTGGVAEELDRIRETLRWFEGLSGGEKRENSHIPLVMFGQARKATLDIRLLNAAAANEAGSKTNRAVAEILRIYRESSPYNGTQLVFADVYQSPAVNGLFDREKANPTAKRFNLFEDIKRKLIAAGVPADEVATVPEDANKREPVFVKVRTGEIRIMLGTSERMGVGVNVQERLAALHHLDAPNRPTDFEQRNGRILRQGNQHAVWNLPVEILTYGVDRTLDATAYGRLAIKQKFINQVLKGHISEQEVSDIGADDDFAAMSFDQMMATLSGSQYAMLYTARQLDLSRVMQAKKNWKRGLIDAQTQVERAREIIARKQPLLPTLEAELDVIQNRFGQPYEVHTVEVGRCVYREKWGAAVQDLFDKMRGQVKRKLQPQETISVNGMLLTITAEMVQEFLYERPKCHYFYSWGQSIAGEVTTAPGLFLSLRASIAHAGELPALTRQDINRARQIETEFSRKLNEPFRREAELQRLEDEVAELQQKLEQESQETAEIASVE